MNIHVLILFETTLYLLLLGCSLYLLTAMSGQRRWLMLIFTFSFGVAFIAGLLSLAGLIKPGSADPFIQYLSHCASGGFIFLLALDRFLFLRGWGTREKKQQKGKSHHVGIPTSG